MCTLTSRVNTVARSRSRSPLPRRPEVARPEVAASAVVDTAAGELSQDTEEEINALLADVYYAIEAAEQKIARAKSRLRELADAQNS